MSKRRNENINLKHPNISSYCSPKGLPGSNFLKIFNIEIIFYMPNTLNISNISLLDVRPESPLDPGKAMVLVEVQRPSCLRAWEHLEVPHNHHHCNLQLEKSKAHAQAGSWTLAEPLEGVRVPFALFLGCPVIGVEGVRMRPVLWISVVMIGVEGEHVVLLQHEISSWNGIVRMR